MRYTTRLLLSALLGFAFGVLFKRPGLGILIGVIVGAIAPVDRYLMNPLTYLAVGGVALAFVNPAFFGVLLLIFLAPILLSINLFSPDRTSDGNWSIFDLIGGDSPNDAMMGLLAGFVKKSPASRDEQFQLVKRFIRQTTLGFSRETLWETFKDHYDDDIDVPELAGNLQSKTSREQQKYFLQILVSLGQVNGSLTEEEKKFIRSITSHLDLSESEVEAILSASSNGNRRRRRRRAGGNRRNRRSPGTGSTTVSEAYRILDVDPSANKKDVKKAYQQKVKQHHPDQFNDRDDERAQRAEEKMAEINEAYETIKDRW